jgi:hypothetical protein
MTTVTMGGSLRIEAQLVAALSGDKQGGEVGRDALLVSFAAAGGSAPTLSGFLSGTATVAAAGDLLLAHASDPLQGFGDAAYSEGFSPAGARIKLLLVRNTDPTNSLTVARKSTAGLALFDAAGDSITLAPGDELVLYKPAGGAPLATGSNDGLTLTPSAGTPTAQILVAYGP